MRIYVFGNLLYEKDSLPIKLIHLLKKEFPKIEFIEFEPTEGIETLKEKNLIIIDTIQGINDVVLFKEIEKIKTESIVSLHDFDLGYNLKLLKKFGLIENVFIIGVPENIEVNMAIEKIKSILIKLSLNIF
ncbi:MAG: hypothetical protein QXE31_00685 [Candidatus Woesearchaeota archaeon]